MFWIVLGKSSLSLFPGLNRNPILRRHFVAGKALSMLGLLIGLLYLIWCLIRLLIL